MKNIFKLCLCLAMALYELPLMAQGVIVYKKDGTAVKYMYEEFDSIVAFDASDSSSDYQMVDLGLPSGTLWADRNVGADSPEAYGDYFAWGETTPKSVYNWSTYKWCNGSSNTQTKYCTDSSYGTVDNKTVLDPEDDAATVNMGAGWRMPTFEEMKELLNKCTCTWTTQNGVEGRKVTGPNGNSIFLPAAGCRGGDNLNDAGSCGYYWTSSRNAEYYSYFAYKLDFNSSDFYWSYTYRSSGSSVRAVANKNTNEGEGDDNGGSTPQGGNRTFTVNGVSFTMISVSGGTFQMGATSEQASDAYDDEYPVHSVTLSDYYIGETEVTQELWKAVSNPSYISGNLQRPVECVSWNDCQTFIQMLNELTGENFSLPTEAQWEYAARGGSQSQGYKYSGSDNIDDVAWYYENSCDKGSSHPDYGTHSVKTKAPNELGIYDMSGNVWEWCQDCFANYSSSAVTDPTGPSSGSSRVLRGGGWDNNAWYCRVAVRGNSNPGYRYDHCGLRLSLSSFQK